jgi:hypothetical protein
MVEEPGHDRSELGGEEEHIRIGFLFKQAATGGNIIGFHRAENLIEPIQLIFLEMKFHHSLGVHGNDGGTVVENDVQVVILSPVKDHGNLLEQFFYLSTVFRHGRTSQRLNKQGTVS